MPRLSRLSPDQLSLELRALYDALDGNGQAAGGVFGLLYAEHLEAGSRDRAPNGVARRAGLTCGPDVNTGFLIARYVSAQLRPEHMSLLNRPK